MKFNEIKEQLKTILEATEDTNTIQTVASIENMLTDSEKDYNELVSKHDELKKAYKDSIMHGGFTNAPIEDNATGTTVVSFEEMLSQFANKK